MIAYDYFGKEQTIFYKKWPNGLDIYFIPNNKNIDYYIELVTKYGSEIEEFKAKNSDNYTKIPFGTAHYLEHKLFDMPSSNAFSYFGNLGVYTNAGTNYLSTKYYISGHKNLRKALDYFLTMLFTPHFTPETVMNERGIIEEEIKMYDDDPEWILDYATKKALYHDKYQNKIAGTIDSIQEIDAHILQEIYDIFYQPKNMFLIVSGKFKMADVLNVLENNVAFNRIQNDYPIIYKNPKETKEIVKEYQRLEGNIICTKFSYAFKFSLDDFSIKDKYLLKTYLNLIFTCLLEDGSAFYQKIFEDDLATYAYINNIIDEDIYSLVINVESEYADLVKEEIDRVLNNIVMQEEDLKRMKKVWLSLYIRTLDSSDSISNIAFDELLRTNKVFDAYKMMQKINYTDLLKIIQELNFQNKTFTLMVPINS